MLFAGKRILLTALALPLVAALGACDSDETTVVRGGSYLLELTDCQGFFGAPNEHSGIGEESCSSVCVCAEGEFAPHYDEAFITSLREWELINPPGELTEDPYLNPDDYPRRDDEFCGVIVEDRENPNSPSNRAPSGWSQVQMHAPPHARSSERTDYYGRATLLDPNAL